MHSADGVIEGLSTRGSRVHVSAAHSPHFVLSSSNRRLLLFSFSLSLRYEEAAVDAGNTACSDDPED